MVFSAHGVAPTVYGPQPPNGPPHTIDATCPLVTKVHNEASEDSPRDDYDILLIGHQRS